ncbi:ROK family protein [Acidicapsa ligni]|uniref:ROK family protein n=1 Tax=Acidicapsa ligni TaxID=542300 RepID=UPI0021DFF3B2|nr:ROK family protein [Acidicapsa ligni]
MDFSIGVDLGGTNLRIAAYSPASGVLEVISLPTRLASGSLAVVDDLCDGVQALIARHSDEYELSGIGIGLPGPLELPAGRVHSPPNLPGWDQFEFRREVEARIGRHVAIDKDANLAALAEAGLGLGFEMGVSSLCMLTLGTGIGNGIVLDGKVYHGAMGMAGEAGHLTIDPDGPVCGCKNTGCLEVFASATGVVRMAREAISKGAEGLGRLHDIDGGQFSARTVAEAAKGGDVDAQRIFETVGRSIGIGLAELVNTLNLPLYVIGGGLVAAWELFAPFALKELRARSYVYRLTEPGSAVGSAFSFGGTQVLPAKLGTDAGLLGACLLGMNEI